MVRDSVNEVREECEKLLKEADAVAERIDKLYCCKALRKSLDEMLAGYSDEEYEEKRMRELKCQCEKDAITLECILGTSNIKLDNRYRERLRIAQKYTQMRSLIADLRRKNETRALASLLADCEPLSKLMLQTMHINFELTDEEKELFDVINSHIQKYAMEMV